MHRQTNFAHRRNSDGSYDSICSKCYATAARAWTEESLSSSESVHVCDTSDLDLVHQGSIPASIPTVGDWSQGIAAQAPTDPDRTATENSLDTLHTKPRWTVERDQAD